MYVLFYVSKYARVSVILFSCVIRFQTFPLRFRLIMGEIFPDSIRGIAASVAVTINWAFAFLVTETFASTRASIGGSGVFWMYAAVCILGAAFVYFRLPETKVQMCVCESCFSYAAQSSIH